MNESLTEDITITGVGNIVHPDDCVCDGERCALEDDE